MVFSRVRLYVRLLPVLFLFALVAVADSRAGRYALILGEPPLAELDADRKSSDHHQAAAQIDASQQRLKAALAERKIAVSGSVQTLLNAVFVVAGDEVAGTLAALPGVARVERMHAIKRHMTRAGALVNVNAAWNLAGGVQNAGTGVRIAVLDTGIDHEHPAMSAAGLTPPVGFPKCSGEDCAYTNGKVIAARSYVRMLVLGDIPEDSRPDDLSPRDRVGHGTAVAMVAAGNRVESPLGTVTGIAPRAYLGSYKVFGSPGVNDVAFDDVIITALEDALNDGMDIAVLSEGRSALWSANDRTQDGRPRDPLVAAVENATLRGLTVVISAGNDGDRGIVAPTLNSINTPGSAPSAITVGATTNARIYYSQVRAEGPGTPADLQRIAAIFGDGPRPAPSVSGPLRDTATFGNAATACVPLGNQTLAGAIAIVDRGECSFLAKVINSAQAGAVGVIVVQSGGSDFIFQMTNLAGSGIPAVMIGGTAGKALRDFVAANPDRPGTLDTRLFALNDDPDFLAFFSSFGPNITGLAIKPEVVAPGSFLYMAGQKFDPNGNLFDPTGFTAAEGTSFSAPMAAGAAALFKQRFRTARPAFVKSAVVNTATDDVRDVDSQGRSVPASILGMGAGKLNAAGAVQTDVVAEPAVLSFGAIRAVDAAIPLAFTNLGSATVTLRIDIRPRTPERGARIQVSEAAFPLAAGQSRQITARVTGALPPAGAYEGELAVSGGAVSLRIPYLYIVPEGAPFNALALLSNNFDGVVNSQVPGRLTFKVIDRFGVPVASAPVRYGVTLGGGRIVVANDRTDELGIAEASQALLGPELGEQEFAAQTGNLTVYFPGRARLLPVIRTDGVVNAASGSVGQGLAPGSYVSIFGRNLSDVTVAGKTLSLPLSLANVSVSFDVPSRGLSLPGRLHFVSEGQINVQAPWELSGLNSALMKVSIGNWSSALYTVPLAEASPAVFEYFDAESGRRLSAALDANFRLITASNPARRGQFIQLYVNGLGTVDQNVASGEPSPSNPLARTLQTPSVTIGNTEADVVFSGLAPGIVGLYQINVRVNPNTPPGIVPVVVTINGVASRAASLPVQ